MTIYDFLETVNDNFETVFMLFDCNTEVLVFMATEVAENTCEFSRDDFLYSKYSYLEINSIDMWIDKGKIYIEFNVDIEEEE